MQSEQARAVIRAPGSEPADRVILTLRRHGTLSRAEIARATGLARSTVSETIAMLASQGLVIEGDVQRTGGIGRPGVGVSLDPRAGVWIGIDFGYRNVRAVLADVSHTILATDEIPLGANYGPEAGLDAAERLVDHVLRETRLRRETIVAIGAAIPGPVDPMTGTIMGTSMIPTWTGVHVAEELTRRLRHEVMVDNDSNCGLLAEHAWGAGQPYRDAVYLKLHSGVGGAVLVGGELVRGAQGTAGEFGHITIDPAGPLCACGGRGCLEVYVGIPALLRQLRPIKGPDLTFHDLAEAARAQDRPTQRVLAEAAEIIGQAAATISSIIGPEAIVVGGASVAFGSGWLRAIEAAYERNSLAGRQGRHSPTVVVRGTLGRHASALGAIVMLLSSLGVEPSTPPRRRSAAPSP